jgi:hypothetical protein
MLIRSLRIVGLFSLAAWIVMVGEATARSTMEFHHAALCTQKNYQGSTELSYSQYGVQNDSLVGPRIVSCGSQLRSDINTRVDIQVYDRHPSQEVHCTVSLMGAADELIFASSTNSTGFGAAAQLISVNIPSVASPFVTVDCSIPPNFPGNGLSHVVLWNVL